MGHKGTENAVIVMGNADIFAAYLDRSTLKMSPHKTVTYNLYNAFPYTKTSHTALSEAEHRSHFGSAKNSHTFPSRANYVVSIVGVLL